MKTIFFVVCDLLLIIILLYCCDVDNNDAIARFRLFRVINLCEKYGPDGNRHHAFDM